MWNDLGMVHLIVGNPWCLLPSLRILFTAQPSSKRAEPLHNSWEGDIHVQHTDGTSDTVVADGMKGAPNSCSSKPPHGDSSPHLLYTVATRMSGEVRIHSPPTK